MERSIPHGRAELAKHEPHGGHVLLLFYHGDAPLNELVHIKVIVQEPIPPPVADDKILRPRSTYLGGVVPAWPGPTTLRTSVTNVTINVTRIIVTVT
jgi:hypothetical protein